MEMARVKELLTAMADGIDPFTGEYFPREHICNQPEVIRALHQVLDILSEHKKRSSLPNAGKPWTSIEEEKLMDEFASQMKISAIAKEHGRSRGSIEAKLANLGLLEDSYYTRKMR